DIYCLYEETLPGHQGPDLSPCNFWGHLKARFKPLGSRSPEAKAFIQTVGITDHLFPSDPVNTGFNFDLIFKISKVLSRVKTFKVTDPLSIVENAGFLEYTKKLQPLYSVPSRKQLTTKLLPQEYDIIHYKLKSMLETITDLSITTDMWTSDLLATREVFDSHTGINIATTLKNIFNEWDIADKIVTIVSDNGSNIKNAINEHLLKYHHPTIVGHFKHSSHATGKLREFQLQMNLPILKVKQDVVTRWNSSLIMIERLIDIKNPLSATMSSLPQAPNYLNACEWEIILDCIHILKPFEIMTAELSGENYVTISSIIPLIRGLQHILKSVQIKTSIDEAFKNTLIDVANRRLGQLEKNKIVAKATFLDPRFKKTAFGLLENANNVQKWISDELTPMIICANDINNFEVNKIQSTITVTASTSDTNDSIWDHFDNKVSQVQSSSSPSTTSTLIIRQYLKMPLLDRKKKSITFLEAA
ncbi:zinc finger BED domain-containing protein 1-like, partial [Melanaphis sacchari]|uniref:zinc finger BED domain-containing protein 1-like n=1 Tax=Melanaphis sacchari TaxID=742174 RepID=UPI000DC1421C